MRKVRKKSQEVKGKEKEGEISEEGKISEEGEISALGLFREHTALPTKPFQAQLGCS